MGRGAATAAAGAGKLAQNVSWLWRGPRRALGAARDLYVRSLTGCAGHLPADAAFGYPAAFAAGSSAPSFSASSSRRASSADFGADEDLRELIRAASQRRAAEQEQERQRHPAAVPRSHSVAAGGAGAGAMARIDEDGPCDFASAAVAVFPRSRSCAPGHGGRMVGAAAGRGRGAGSPLSPPDAADADASVGGSS